MSRKEQHNETWVCIHQLINNSGFVFCPDLVDIIYSYFISGRLILIAPRTITPTANAEAVGSGTSILVSSWLYSVDADSFHQIEIPVPAMDAGSGGPGSTGPGVTSPPPPPAHAKSIGPDAQYRYALTYLNTSLFLSSLLVRINRRVVGVRGNRKAQWMVASLPTSASLTSNAKPPGTAAATGTGTATGTERTVTAKPFPFEIPHQISCARNLTTDIHPSRRCLVPVPVPAQVPVPVTVACDDQIISFGGSTFARSYTGAIITYSLSPPLDSGGSGTGGGRVAAYEVDDYIKVYRPHELAFWRSADVVMLRSNTVGSPDQMWTIRYHNRLAHRFQPTIKYNENDDRVTPRWCIHPRTAWQPENECESCDEVMTACFGIWNRESDGTTTTTTTTTTTGTESDEQLVAVVTRNLHSVIAISTVKAKAAAWNHLPVPPELADSGNRDSHLQRQFRVFSANGLLFLAVFVATGSDAAEERVHLCEYFGWYNPVAVCWVRSKSPLPIVSSDPTVLVIHR